eukprot:Trichotokara_eunicae@DN7672_c0_g1_i1.p1
MPPPQWTTRVLNNEEESYEEVENFRRNYDAQQLLTRHPKQRFSKLPGLFLAGSFVCSETMRHLRRYDAQLETTERLCSLTNLRLSFLMFYEQFERAIVEGLHTTVEKPFRASDFSLSSVNRMIDRSYLIAETRAAIKNIKDELLISKEGKKVERELSTLYESLNSVLLIMNLHILGPRACDLCVDLLSKFIEKKKKKKKKKVLC